jgi:hypothetical protein
VIVTQVPGGERGGLPVATMEREPTHLARPSVVCRAAVRHTVMVTPSHLDRIGRITHSSTARAWVNRPIVPGAGRGGCMVRPMRPGAPAPDDGVVPGTARRGQEAQMHARITDIPVEMQVDEIETRGITWGDVTVRHIDLPAGVDFTPLFKGLPDDLCQCAHWGYVTDGSITVRFADGTEETTHAGEVFYWRGGHTGWTDGGVKFIEFSPADEIAPVLEHLASQFSTSG